MKTQKLHNQVPFVVAEYFFPTNKQTNAALLSAAPPPPLPPPPTNKVLLPTSSPYSQIFFFFFFFTTASPSRQRDLAPNTQDLSTKWDEEDHEETPMRTKTAAQDCQTAYIHMYKNTYSIVLIYECLYRTVFL
jgi:hypothetical protein